MEPLFVFVLGLTFIIPFLLVAVCVCRPPGFRSGLRRPKSR
jgi:hypothetical protein